MCGVFGIIVLLETGNAAIVSDLLLEDPVWHDKLEDAERDGAYGPLEAILYHRPLRVPCCIESEWWFGIPQSQQIPLRLVAYHAGATRNRDLYKWLLQHSMRIGTDLDMKFGEPPENQYVRARQFAEQKGNMASGR
jgi:hypothetical protein